MCDDQPQPLLAAFPIQTHRQRSSALRGSRSAMAARPATHTLAAASMLPQRARAPPPPPPRAHQHKALAHLVVVQEGLVALVDRAADHLARAAGAGAGTAAVGQVDARLLGGVQQVGVRADLDDLRGRDERGAGIEGRSESCQAHGVAAAESHRRPTPSGRRSRAALQAGQGAAPHRARIAPSSPSGA